MKKEKKEEFVSRLPKGSIVNQFLDKCNQSKIALKKNTFQKIQTNNWTLAKKMPKGRLKQGGGPQNKFVKIYRLLGREEIGEGKEQNWDNVFVLLCKKN